MTDRLQPTDREAAKEAILEPIRDETLSGGPVAANEESADSFEQDRADKSLPDVETAPNPPEED